MVTPLHEKIRCFIMNVVRRISNHYYGCCDNNFKNCDRCHFVKDE